MTQPSFHSICRWTFNDGAGRFVPGLRPGWSEKELSTVQVINVIQQQIKPRLPDNVKLGFEVHYDNEVNEENAAELAGALTSANMHLAMITPGSHGAFAYGGPASLDKTERESANLLGRQTVDLAYGELRSAWYPDPDMAPTLVLWNGSWGYHTHGPHVLDMNEHLLESISDLFSYEEDQPSGSMYRGIEPKPNEGHPYMLLPTVADALLFVNRLISHYGVSRNRTGVNMELGHTQMIGLDTVNDVAIQLGAEGEIPHFHVNSQGGVDGIAAGGSGQYDIDHPFEISWPGISIARLFQDAGYTRWKGHDMQARPFDDEIHAADRVVRSILSWEACNDVATTFGWTEFNRLLTYRRDGEAGDMARQANSDAYHRFKKLYTPA